MIDETKSKRAQNLAILVIVIGLVPFIFFLIRGFFLRFSMPPVASPHAAIATPKITTGLRKVGGNLEVTITIKDPSTEPLTGFEVNKLKVETTDVVSVKDNLGSIVGGGTIIKHYTIPMPAKMKRSAMVSYDVLYQQGPYGGGGASGFEYVDVK